MNKIWRSLLKDNESDPYYKITGIYQCMEWYFRTTLNCSEVKPLGQMIYDSMGCFTEEQRQLAGKIARYRNFVSHCDKETTDIHGRALEKLDCVMDCFGGFCESVGGAAGAFASSFLKYDKKSKAFCTPIPANLGFSKDKPLNVKPYKEDADCVPDLRRHFFCADDYRFVEGKEVRGMAATQVFAPDPKRFVVLPTPGEEPGETNAEGVDNAWMTERFDLERELKRSFARTLKLMQMWISGKTGFFGCKRENHAAPKASYELPFKERCSLDVVITVMAPETAAPGKDAPRKKPKKSRKENKDWTLEKIDKSPVNRRLRSGDKSQKFRNST